MSPVVHGRGEPPSEPPPSRWTDCAQCGRPLNDPEHDSRSHRNHAYQPKAASPQRAREWTVDEMATAMLNQEEAERLRAAFLSQQIAATVSNQLRVPMQELATAIGQSMGVGQLSPNMRMDRLAQLAGHRRIGYGEALQRHAAVIEEQFDRPRDPNVSGGRHRRRRHRRFPCNWWKRRCRCHECHRKPDYARIEAMERECRIRDESGALAWPAPEVGSHDQYGRTVVAVVDEMPVWDRAAPPAPPRRDPGQRQRV